MINFSLFKTSLFFPANSNKERAVRGLRLWQGLLAGRGFDPDLQSMPEFTGIMLLFIQGPWKAADPCSDQKAWQYEPPSTLDHQECSE